MTRLLQIALLLVLFSSCKKPEKCKGGSGGNLTVNVHLMHHSTRIYGLSDKIRDTVWVRYDALDYPSNGLAGFHAMYVGDSGSAHVSIPGLQCGSYYFYAVGADTAFIPGDTVGVSGGLSFTTAEKDGQINLTIPVSE